MHVVALCLMEKYSHPTKGKYNKPSQSQDSKMKHHWVEPNMTSTLPTSKTLVANIISYWHRHVGDTNMVIIMKPTSLVLVSMS